MMVEALTSAGFKHHADPTMLRHSQRVVMMHQCSLAELLARAAFKPIN